MLGKQYIGSLLLLGIFGLSFSQSLDKIGKEGGVTLGGGISTNHVYYNAWGKDPNRDPYAYVVTGNLNLNMYDFAVPISFAYSNQQFTYRQPFNQVGFSPKYKWVTGHFGMRNMSFSPYTLAGHVFFGGGVDLKPSDKWNISAMYGRLNDAVEMSENTSKPTYLRKGTGLKVNYVGNTGDYTFILFGAYDDPNSLLIAPDSLGITPEENMVWSFGLNQKIGKKLSFKGEFARSAYTRDSRTDASSSELQFYDKIFFIPTRTTTVFYNAFKSSLDYDFGFMKVGTGFEQIDPDYRTLGAYYFNNDLRNLTLNLSTNLFEKKVQLRAQGGYQTNNLDGSKFSTQRRGIGSLNLTWKASQRMNWNASYSNFLSYTNIITAEQRLSSLTPYDNLDTLNFTQIVSSASLNTSYALKATKKVKSGLALAGTLQQTGDANGQEAVTSNSRIYNGSLSYSHQYTKKQLSLSTGTNLNVTELETGDIQLVGLTLAINKAMFEKKLKTSLSTSANNSYIAGGLQGQVYAVRSSAAYTLKKSHGFNMNVVWLHRDSGSSFSEFTATFGYRYNFSTGKKDKK